MAKFGKACTVILGILITPIILFCFIALLLYFPPFQNWAVKLAADYASDKSGMEISIRHIHLGFPLDLDVEGVKVLQPNDSLPGVRDTVANVASTVVSLQARPLLKGDIEVDELHLLKVRFNTTRFISDCRVKGTAREILIRSHGVNLPKECVVVNETLLDGASVDVQLSDTARKDTSTTENRWKLEIQRLKIKNSDVTVHLPGDSLVVGGTIGFASVEGGFINLLSQRFRFKKAAFANTSVRVDIGRDAPRLVRLDRGGIDYNHIRLQKISLSATDLDIDSLSARAACLWLSTTTSNLRLHSVFFPYNTFADKDPGSMSLVAEGHISGEDIRFFCPTLPKQVRRFVPYSGVDLVTGFSGNLRSFALNLDASARTPLFTHLRTQVLGRGSRYEVDGSLVYGKGRLDVDGWANFSQMAYNARISSLRFPLQSVLPGYGLSPLTARISASGRGTDVFSRRTRLDADVRIGDFSYSKFNLAGSTASARIRNGRIDALLHCSNRLLSGNIALRALMNLKDIKATVDCQLQKLDLFALKLVRAPLSTSMNAHLDLASDLRDFYEAEGFLTDVNIQDTDSVYRPEDLQMNVFTNRDTTYCNFNSGDLVLHLNAGGGYRRLMTTGNRVVDEVLRQIHNRNISADSIARVLPYGHLQLHSLSHNFFARYLGTQDINFKEVYADISSSPSAGINGFAHVDSLVAMGTQIDMINLNLETSSRGIHYDGQVQNFPGNAQKVFNVTFNGLVYEMGSDLDVSLYNYNDSLSVRVGLNASIVDSSKGWKCLRGSDGLLVRLNPDDLVLAGKPYSVNPDNFLLLGKGNRLWANLLVKDRFGTGIQLRSENDNNEFDEDASNDDIKQDLTLSIIDLDLYRLSQAVPYVPDMKGCLNGDFHVLLRPDELSVSSSMGIDRLEYEGVDVGNISTDFVYMPGQNGVHHLDGILNHNNSEVASIVGSYHEGTDSVQADVSMDRLPLNLVNAFIPDQILGLEGYGDGKLSVNGPLSDLDISGALKLDSAYVVSVPYGVRLRAEEKVVAINDSRVNLDKFNLYAYNDKPISVDGFVDFSNPSDMSMDIRVGGKDLMLINSKQKRRSEVFGKAYADLFARVWGKLDNLSAKGIVKVLGTSDMTYLMKDSPINTDNQMDGLVKFSDFSGREEGVVLETARPASLNMDLDIEISPGARVFCALNNTKTNYVDVIGSGSLKMLYRSGDISMNGRYEISSGEMKYSLPVIPLKTFSIQSGSYVEFRGDMLNPRLNITALEKTKATVSQEGTSDRSVTFNCGVKISKTLKALGLEFVIEALDDNTVQSQLQTKSVEDRAKIAVTLLTTGMYYDEGTAGSLSTSAALSSFLSNQISNITGNALRSLDLSVGMGNTVDASTGAMNTDYSFKFAKRFWGNRISVTVGGKVSSGSNSSNNANFLDNVAVEYRLTQKTDLNLKAFYDRQVYDYLEGYVGKYGVGIVWKKQVAGFLDFFKPASYGLGKKALKAEKALKTDNVENGKVDR